MKTAWKLLATNKNNGLGTEFCCCFSSMVEHFFLSVWKVQGSILWFFIECEVPERLLLLPVSVYQKEDEWTRSVNGTPYLLNKGHRRLPTEIDKTVAILRDYPQSFPIYCAAKCLEELSSYSSQDFTANWPVKQSNQSDKATFLNSWILEDVPLQSRFFRSRGGSGGGRDLNPSYSHPAR